jgi:hypothetical protein
MPMLNRPALNAALDVEFERDELNQPLIRDLLDVIGGDCNPSFTVDQAALAAARIARALPELQIEAQS